MASGRRTKRSTSTNSATGVKRTNTRTVSANGSTNLTQSVSSKTGPVRYTKTKNSDGLYKISKTTKLGDYYERETVDSYSSRKASPLPKKVSTPGYSKPLVPKVAKQKSTTSRKPVRAVNYEGIGNLIFLAGLFLVISMIALFG